MSNRRKERKQQENCVGMVINCSESSRLQRAVINVQTIVADPTCPGKYCTGPLGVTIPGREMVHVLALRKEVGKGHVTSSQPFESIKRAQKRAPGSAASPPYMEDLKVQKKRLVRSLSETVTI
jgi:hypothetical protein